jgi:hypothetical protein
VNQETAMRIVPILLCLATAAPAAAQVLQRDFDPGRNGPWDVTPLAAGDAPCDPRGVAVSGGAPHVVCKLPLEGPPVGGVLLRAAGGRAVQVGPDLGDDPGVLALVDGALLIGTKGTVGSSAPRVVRLDGDAWIPLHDDALGAEVRALALHDGALHVATKSDGVFRLDGRALRRVGARRTIVPEGYAWSGVGDWTTDVHDAVLDGAGVVATGKDLRVRRWEGSTWSDRGNVAEATYDAGGAPVAFLREPKTVAIDANGALYVGTKGMLGSAEGKDVGAVWRWTGASWTRLGAAPMKKEVKRIVAAGGALWAGTSESGVWRWDGAAWSEANAGLPAEVDGKVKGERLGLGADGALYIAIRNSVLRRGLADATWTEVGFFPGGEEATSVLVDPDGTLWVGAKVGTSSGAVYRKAGSTWVQLGGDLSREVKQLVRTSTGERYAVLGGGAGAVRWTGTAWASILGNLTGDASDFKSIVLVSDLDLLAVTKVGIQSGKLQREPLEVIESAVRNLDVGGMAALASGLYVSSKQDGVFRTALDPRGDDGWWWIDGAAGVPDAELVSLAAFDRRAFVIGKRLLYDATAGEGGLLHAEAFGTNPGKAALDGNGELVFAGETDFTAVALDGDRVFAGTKDGLFVSRNGGFTWELYNGPAEVKGLAIVDGVLHALVVSRIVPDPAGAPTVEVKTAALWSRSLADDAPPPPERGGCSTSSPAGLGGILVIGIALVPALFRRRDRKPAKPTRWLGWSRKLHTWAGVVLALFIFVEGCTGLFLTHKDDLPGLAHAPLPFGGAAARAVKLERGTLDPDDPAHLIAATRDRVVHSRDGGASWSAVSPTSGFDKIEALAVAAGAIWVGHGEGLARCTLDGAACRAVDLGVAGRAEIRAIASRHGRLFVALHRHGVRVSDDGGARWTDATASLWSDARALDEKGERHVHGVALDGDALWVATSAGLFHSTADGWAAAGLPGRELEGVAVTADGSVWVLAKQPAALLVSRDRGIAWREVRGGTELDEGSLVADPTAHDRVLVGTKRAVLAAVADGSTAAVSVPGLGAEGPIGLAAAGDRVVAVRGARSATLASGAWQVAPAPVAIEGGGKPLTVGKFLEDLHTGALFGKRLWIVYDLGALAMIVFVFTGLHMWIAPILVRRRKRAQQAGLPRAAGSGGVGEAR